ncbi:MULTISPECIES: hypothetical protein [Paenibacillus]|nr:hypothetical protein [Paenibacillus lautus]
MRKWLTKSGLNLAFVVIILSIIYVALFPDVISNLSALFAMRVLMDL